MIAPALFRLKRIGDQGRLPGAEVKKRGRKSAPLLAFGYFSY